MNDVADVDPFVLATAVFACAVIIIVGVVQEVGGRRRDTRLNARLDPAGKNAWTFTTVAGTAVLIRLDPSRWHLTCGWEDMTGVYGSREAAVDDADRAAGMWAEDAQVRQARARAENLLNPRPVQPAPPRTSEGYPT